MGNVSDLNFSSHSSIFNNFVTERIRKSGRCAVLDGHCIIFGSGEDGVGESGRQSGRFLDSQSQAGEELAKVDRRHAAVADRDDVVPSSVGQLSEKVLFVQVGVVKRTEDPVGVVIVQRTQGPFCSWSSRSFNSQNIRWVDGFVLRNWMSCKNQWALFNATLTTTLRDLAFRGVAVHRLVGARRHDGKSVRCHC